MSITAFTPQPDADLDAPRCTARFTSHLHVPGVVHCVFARDHSDAPLDRKRHGAMLGTALFRWSEAEDGAVAAGPAWRCLHCDAPCSPRTFRGCCSARCAYLDNDSDTYAERED